jgi:hypothetical protein
MKTITILMYIFHLHKIFVIHVHVDVDGVRWLLWTAATNGPIVHNGNDNEYGEPWCNNTDGKAKELREEPVPVPLCPPQIPHGLMWVHTIHYYQIKNNNLDLLVPTIKKSSGKN